MNFDTAFDTLMGHEGFFSDNPNDPGRKTTWGVTENVARANGFTGDMRELPKAFARDVYKRLYWDAVRADELPSVVRYDVFDAAVNSGVTQAVKWLQRVVGVMDDGVIGRVTLAACSSLDASSIKARFNGQRLLFMTDLAVWGTFGKGWARRIAKNLLGGA